MIISFYAIFLPAAAFSHSQFSHLCARNNTELFGKLPLKKKNAVEQQDSAVLQIPASQLPGIETSEFCCWIFLKLAQLSLSSHTSLLCAVMLPNSMCTMPHVPPTVARTC